MISLLRRLSSCFLILVACGTAEAQQATNDILVGVAYPATGSNNWLGQPSRHGFDQAFEDFNNPSFKFSRPLNRTLTPVVKDDQCDPDVAKKVAQELIDAGVKVVIGHQCSGAALAAAPLYIANGVMLISTHATNPDLTDLYGKRNVFRMVGRDNQQAQIAASYIEARYTPGEKFAILHDGKSYGSKLADLVRGSMSQSRFGNFPVEKVIPNTAEYTRTLNRFFGPSATAEDRVNVVYFAGYSDVGIPLRKDIWERDKNVVMFGGDGLFSRNFSVETGSDAARKTFITSPPSYSNRTEAADVVRALQEDTKDIYPQTMHAYAAVQVWVRAVHRAGSSEAETVSSALRNGNFETVIGLVGFDEKGDRVGFDANGSRSKPQPLFVWYTWRNDTLFQLDQQGWRHRGLVCRTQAGLKELRMDPGPIDGLDGEMTYRALERFRDSPPKKSFPLSIDEAVVKMIEDTLATERLLSLEVGKRLNVCQIQAGLRALNYSAGPLDGVVGNKTRQAVEAFKRDEGLEFNDLIHDHDHLRDLIEKKVLDDVSKIKPLG